jgi:hypothetical protein
MMDRSLRDHLIAMLTEPNAHLTFEEAIDIEPKDYGTVLPGLAHSAWQLLEHLRLAQSDIVEFSCNAKHESPPFPEGYWPEDAAPADRQAWNESVQQFQTDLQRMTELVDDESRDLFPRIPHGEGQTLLREALLLAKHNSYHLGQLAMLGKALKRRR